MAETEGKTGGCLCGAVRFEAVGKLGQVVACHCSMCRKQTGHFWASTMIARSGLKLTEAKGLKWFDSSPGIRRGFCGECGSVLFFDVVESDRIDFSPGAFDGPTGLETRAHIYVADKGDYYEIGDGKPQYPQSDR